MSYFSDALKKEYILLTLLREKLDTDMIKPAKAVIAVKKRYRHNHYYKVVKADDSKYKHLYIGNEDSEKLKQIVQSAYKKALLDMVDHDLKLIMHLEKDYEMINIQNVMSRLSPSVRDVPVANTFISELEESKKWLSEPYEKNPREFPKQVIRAKDGTRVRSRGECIIYNALLDAGIPFRYDPVLKFKRKNAYGDYEDVYESPDFQIRCPDGSFILLEHAGLLSSDQYTESLVKKIQLYQLNGYTLGYSLFVTSDQIDGGIDSHEINKVISLIKDRFNFI